MRVEGRKGLILVDVSLCHQLSLNLLIILDPAKSAGSARQTSGALCPASIFYSVFLFFLFFSPEYY